MQNKNYRNVVIQGSGSASIGNTSCIANISSDFVSWNGKGIIVNIETSIVNIDATGFTISGSLTTALELTSASGQSPSLNDSTDYSGQLISNSVGIGSIIDFNSRGDVIFSAIVFAPLFAVTGGAKNITFRTRITIEIID